jgi:citrate synthase
MFPVLFCIPRMAGWLAHWIEALDDPELKIVRPRQNYIGPSKRIYQDIEIRNDHQFFLESTVSNRQKRRESAVITE